MGSRTLHTNAHQHGATLGGLTAPVCAVNRVVSGVLITGVLPAWIGLGPPAGGWVVVAGAEVVGAGGVVVAGFVLVGVGDGAGACGVAVGVVGVGVDFRSGVVGEADDRTGAVVEVVVGAGGGSFVDEGPGGVSGVAGGASGVGLGVEAEQAVVLVGGPGGGPSGVGGSGVGVGCGGAVGGERGELVEGVVGGSGDGLGADAGGLVAVVVIGEPGRRAVLCGEGVGGVIAVGVRTGPGRGGTGRSDDGGVAGAVPGRVVAVQRDVWATYASGGYRDHGLLKAQVPGAAVSAGDVSPAYWAAFRYQRLHADSFALLLGVQPR